MSSHKLINDDMSNVTQNITPDGIPNYTVAYWQANQGTIDGQGPFNIDDTAAHIAAAINALNADPNISQVIVSDNAAITLSASKLIADTSLLSKLVNADSSPATLNLKDTAGHIGNNFATIAQEGQVAAITVSDNTAVVLSVSQITQNLNALALIVNANHTAGQVTARDSGANLAAGTALDTINAHLSVITSIVVNNSAIMTLTAAQIDNDAAALAEVVNSNGNPVSFKVSDTGANIGAHLNALQANAQITTITDSDNSAIDISIAQFTSDSGALSKVHNADSSPVSFHINDNAANISSAFDSLSGNSSVTQIVVTDGPGNEVTITAAQAASDTAALNELYLSGGTTHAHVAVSDTAANISSALDALNSNSHVDKIFISPSGALTLTASQIANDTTALGEIQGGYTIDVSDTAAHITTNLDALQANGHVGQITVSDNNEITVSIAQLTSDATAISELQNANTSTVHVIVSDTASDIAIAIDSLNSNALVNKIIVAIGGEVTISAAQAGSDSTALGELFQSDGTTAAHVAVSDTASNIAGAFDALNGNAHVDKIIVASGGEVTITAAQAANDGTALGELFQSDGATHAHVAVQDTAANISLAFDALNNNSHVDKIIVGGGQTPTPIQEVTISVLQAANDTTALNELYQSDGVTHAHVVVSDSAADISGAFDALNGNTHVNKIVVNDGNEVTITASQAANDATALNELFQSDGATAASVAVQDTAANISSAFDALNNNSHVDKIIVASGGEVTITVAQAAGDGTALGELFQSNGTTPATVTVSDTASAIAGAFDSLNGNTHVDKIIVASGGEVTISAVQAGSDSTALGELFQSDGTTLAYVAVNDTAAQITSALDALNSNHQINKIIVSDSAGNEVMVTVAQAGSDIFALNELYQADGVTVAQAAVNDTASNISAAFSSLHGNTTINKIIVSDSATHEVTITALQAASDTSLLNELYKADGTTPATVAVSDTAANISSAFDALNGNTHVDRIVVNDGLPGHAPVVASEVTISVIQAANDTRALNELFQSDGTTPAHVAVSDTASNIAGAFDALNGNSHVDKIIVASGGEVTITVAQAAGDGTALDELFQSNGTTPATVAVSDTASHIAGAFDALNGNSHVDKIIVSDSATNEVTISVSQAANDTTALFDLYQADGTTPAHVAVGDTASAIASGLSGLNSNAHVDKIIVATGGEVTITVAQLSFTTALAELFQSDGTTHAHVAVSDTAANISSALDGLNSNTQVDNIFISPSGALTLTAAQVATDTTALGEIQGGYTIDVSDTAAHITTNLDALQANGHVGQITVSDNNEITVSIAQLTSDATAISELQNANTSTVHVIVSDTASDIATAIDSLNSNALVNKIIVASGGEVTISASQAAGDGTALGELFQSDGATAAHVAVQDTASALTLALGDLNGNSHVDKIIVSDSATNEVSVSVAQLTSDAHALSELVKADGTTPAKITVTDTAADISGSALDTLNGDGQVNKIIVSDNQDVTVTVAQYSGDATALAELYKADGTTLSNLTVDDTASAISGVLDTLNGDMRVDHIIISDNGSITVNVEQAVDDSHALNELQNADHSPVTLIVQDTGAHIAAALDTLNGISNISSIVISDNSTLTLTAVEVGTDITALSKLSNLDHSGVTIDVVDNAADISTYLTALQNNPDIVSITISDNAPITVTVAQIASDSVVLSELVNADSSPVTLSVVDTAANIRANLAALNQNSQISSITISNNLALKLTIAQISADAHALSIMHNADSTPYKISVSDSAAHITSALDSLNGNSHVSSITVTDNGAITVTVSQITADAHALSELRNANASPYTLKVSDTAAHIGGTAFDALSSNSHVAKIVVADSPANEVTISVSSFSADGHALSELFQSDGTTPAHVEILDAAASISAALGTLNSSAQVDKIVVSDSGSGGEVTVSVAGLTADATALGELYLANGTTHATVAVADQASNITAVIDTLGGNSQVDKIIVTDSGSNEVVVSVAQLTSDATALGELYKANGITHATVTVSDTAACIQANLGSLNSDSQVDKIIVNNSGSNEVVVSIGELTTYATALSELYNLGGTSHANVAVHDTASAITGAFDALETNSQVNKVVVTDSATNEVTLLAAQVANDGLVIGELYQADGTTHANVAVNDTASAISLNFDALSSQGAVDRIVVNDDGPNEVTINVSQAKNDTHALSVLYEANNSTLAHIAVSDTAASISVNLAFLNTDTQVDHIIISDDAALTLNVSQVIHDTTALGEIVGPYSVEVTDTAAHISANLDALQANPNITEIVVSDNKLVTVSIAQLTTDADVIGEMVDANTGTAAALKVLDTAASIQANLGNLKADLSLYNFSQITISDNLAITLTAAQFAADSAVLGDLRNADKSAVSLIVSDTAAHLLTGLDSFQTYNNANPLSKISQLQVSNNAALVLTAAQVSTDAQILGEVVNRNGSSVSFKVTDAAAAIGTYFDALAGNARISLITVSDNATLDITLAQLQADAATLAKVHNANATTYTLEVTGAAADISGAIAALNNNTHITQVDVSDNGQVTANLFQLQHDTTLFSHLFNADGTTHAGVTLADTSTRIDALSTGNIATLISEGVNLIDSTNNKVIFNVAQYEALSSIKLTAGDAVTLSDSASAFAGMTTAELSALGANNVDTVSLSGAGTFDLAHWNALKSGGVTIASAATVNVEIDGTASGDTINATGAGSAHFTLNGGGGADTLIAGATAHDTFYYGSVSDSTGANYDTITGFNGSTDSFTVVNGVTGVDTLVHGGALDGGANFDTELASDIGGSQLAAHHAVLFQVTSGGLAGHTFLIIDQNGQAGYQAGVDIVIDVTGGTHLGSLNMGEFSTGVV